MPDPIDPRRVYTVAEAAPPLGLTAETVGRLCNSGDLRAADVRRNPKPGGRRHWRILGGELLAFLERRSAPAKTTAPAPRRARRQPAGVREFYPAA